MLLMLKKLSIFISGSLLTFSANAAGNKLYDSVAPDNSAYIRLININPTANNIKLNSKSEKQLVPPFSIGGFMFHPPGEFTIDVNGVQENLRSEPLNVVNVINVGGLQYNLTEEYFESKRKSQATLYNLSERPVSLKTINGKHELIKLLGTRSHGSRTVNEIRVHLGVFSGDELLVDVGEVAFKKGRSLSFVVYDKGHLVNVLHVVNTVDSIE